MKHCEILYGKYSSNELHSFPISIWEWANLIWPEFTKRGHAAKSACLQAEKNSIQYRNQNFILQGRMMTNVRR